MSPEDKKEIRDIIREEMSPVNEIINRYKNLIENDDTIGHKGLASRFSELEVTVKKLENIKNAAIWVLSGITVVFNVMADWVKDLVVK